MSGLRVGVAQLAATRDKESNLARAGDLLAAAARDGAEVVVLPEYVMAYDPRPDAVSLAADAEPLDGAFVTGLAGHARRHGVTVVAGVLERGTDGGRPTNTLVALGPDGTLLAAYRKVHLYDAFGDRESDRLRAADPIATVVLVGGLRLGLMTCYDLRFPEMGRFLVDAGADVLLVPAAWVAGPAKADHWRTLLRARAIENTSYVVGTGMTGPRCTGRSMIVDATGKVLAELGEEPGHAVVDLDPDDVARVRADNPSLLNRRFDVRPR